MSYIYMSHNCIVFTLDEISANTTNIMCQILLHIKQRRKYRVKAILKRDMWALKNYFKCILAQ